MVKVKGGKSSEKSINISKVIILIFFTVYLIIYGFGFSIFITNYKYPLPLIIYYLPLICFVIAGFLGIMLIVFLKNIKTQKTLISKSRKKVKTGRIYKQALLLIIFTFSFIPLLAPIIDKGINDQNFSVYNEKWNGASDFKEMLEDEGYTCHNIQSSLSTIERIEEKVLLVIIGANSFYDPIYEIPFFMDFLDDGNSLLLCHDYGSTSTLLWQIYFANMIDEDVEEKIPLTIFPNGVLHDTWPGNYDTRSSFPIIQSFSTTHEITKDIKRVILSKSSSALYNFFGGHSGWESLGATSLYSFVDMDGDERWDPKKDNIDVSFITDSLGEDMGDDAEDSGIYDPEEGTLKMGVYNHTVFMAKETDKARIFISADASLFNNELINKDGYDNQKLAKNIVKWLTRHQNKDKWVIAFDEAHIRPEKSRDMTSAGIYGFYIQYIVHLSTNPITAWIYPILAILTLNKYLPKKNKKKEEEKKAREEEKKEERARFRTSSFFAKKIEWYREKARYGKAITLLYRRLERQLNTLLGGRKITTKNVISMVTAKDPTVSKLKIRRISRFIERILLIKTGKRKVKNEHEFEVLFFEMEWVSSNL